LTPEKIFDARWAITLLGRAMTLLSEEYAVKHKSSTFEALKGFLRIDDTKDSPAPKEAAKALGVGLGTVKTLIHRLRRRYSAILRREIGRTVSEPAEIDGEIRALCNAIIAAEGRINQ
jgi:RNA polymerase sigma-70 factor (ECF subfamily)